jgi:SAM-dependent methyltransferase
MTDATQRADRVDVDPAVDNDSAYAEDNASFTTSLKSSAFDYRYELGRRYHSYREGRHFLPNDEQEQDRMDLLHSQMMLLLDNNLYFAPIKNPGRVLDLGTGTGIWAIDFGDAHPESQVIGNDLSPIQPTYIPSNVEFVVDDMEDEWGYERKPFDFIHARYLAGSIRDWPRLLKQAYRCTAPGGWVEFQDWDCMVESPDNSIPKDSAFWRWHEATISRVAKTNNGRPGPGLEGWFKEAGFTNIVVEKCLIPHNVWPKDQKLKQIGALNLHQWEEGLEGISIGCLNKLPSDEPAWSLEDIQALVAEARADAKNHKYHGQYSL